MLTIPTLQRSTATVSVVRSAITATAELLVCNDIFSYLANIHCRLILAQTSTNVLYIRNWRALLYIRAADVSFSLTRRQHDILLRERTSWPPSWNFEGKSKFRLRQSMRIYAKNLSAKFHPDPIWNDEALGYFWRRCPNNNKMTSDSSWCNNEKCVRIIRAWRV